MITARQSWIDIVKGVCIFLVVLFHCNNQINFSIQTVFDKSIDAHAESFWNFFNWLMHSLRMPVFFAISGLLATRQVCEREFRSVVEKRIVNLLWIFFIWSAILWPITLILNSTGIFTSPLAHRSDVVFYSKSISDFFANLLSANGGLWYIYALVLYFTSTYFARRWRHLVFLLLLFANFLMTFFPPSSLDWGLIALSRNAVYFALGAYYGPTVIRTIASYRFLTTLAILALCIVAFFLKYYGLNFRFIGSFAAILGTFSIGTALEQLFQKSWLNFLKILGSSTLFVYILHIPLIEVFSIILSLEYIKTLLSGNIVGSLIKISQPAFFATLITYLSIIAGRSLDSRLPVLFQPPFKKQLRKYFTPNQLN